MKKLRFQQFMKFDLARRRYVCHLDVTSSPRITHFKTTMLNEDIYEFVHIQNPHFRFDYLTIQLYAIFYRMVLIAFSAIYKNLNDSTSFLLLMEKSLT